MNVGKDDTGLLMLLKTRPETNAGDWGSGGMRGKGGSGGMGGPGESSYHWTEYRTDNHIDANGRAYTTTEGVSRSNPGGWPGASGSKGIPGVAWKAGQRGADGRFSINVPNVAVLFLGVTN